MGIFYGINTTASALTAQRLRMDVVSSNMANIDTTRERMVNGEWEPYRRKMVVMESKEGTGFKNFLNLAQNKVNNPGNGVLIKRIVEDQTPFKQMYNPDHPDANELGYVQYPNVDPLKEMVDMMSATRSYEANVTSLNASKNMLLKALEIGK